MSLPRRPRAFDAPVPNSPFYSSEVTYFQGPYYPAIVTVTSGITINAITGTITVTGGGGGGGGGGTITGITASAPLTVNNANPAVPNLGIQVATPASVGVVSVGTNISIDLAGKIRVSNATTTNRGVVQLVNATNSTSVDSALAAAQGKNLQDQINAITFAANVTLAGTYDASTKRMITVTNAGAQAGFVAGMDYPAADLANEDFFVLVTVAGNGASQGDWYLSNGSAWIFLDVGPQFPAASTTQQGAVALATDTDTYEGMNTALAVTPASLQSKLSDSCDLPDNKSIASSAAVKSVYDIARTAISGGSFSAKGDLLAGTSFSNYARVPVGANGTVLTSNSACSSGMEWKLPTSGGSLTGLTVNAPLTVDNTNPAVPNLGVNLATALNVGVVSVGNNISVDAAGKIRVADASLLGKGVVQLANVTNSTSTTQALTAAQGKKLQDILNALTLAGDLILAGTYDALNNTMTTVTNAGALAGFTVGASRPAAAPGNRDFFVLVTVAGGEATQGDWYLSNGNAWVFLDVGPQFPLASEDEPGAVELATVQETYEGTNSTSAVTPVALQSKVSDELELFDSNYIASSCALACTYQLASGAVPVCSYSDKGIILVGLGVCDYEEHPLGADNQVLTVNSACPSGVEWKSPSAASAALPDSFGTVLGQTDITNYNISLDGSCRALINNGCGGENIAIGRCAMESNTSGSGNIALGTEALRYNQTGIANLALGNRAGLIINTGDANIMVGDGAGSGLTTGNSNILIGLNAGSRIVGACCNIALGANALRNDTNCGCNIAIGNNAGCTITGGGNIVIGHNIDLLNPHLNNQLAIGRWITGDVNRTVQFGGGIKDVYGSCGTNGQVLASTGANGLQWATLPEPPEPTPPSFQTLTVARDFSGGQTKNIFQVSTNDVQFYAAWVYLHARKNTSNYASMAQFMNFYSPGGLIAPGTQEVLKVNTVNNFGNWVSGSSGNKATYRFTATAAGRYTLTIKYMLFQGGPIVAV